MPEGQLENPRELKPFPDPTGATHAAIDDAKEQLRREAAAQLALINARLTGIETAATKFEANLQRVPTDVQKEVENLKELHGEKFESIKVQLDLAAKLNALVSSDAKDAVADALAAQQKSVADAFAAQEKSVDKQDATNKDAISALQVIFDNSVSAQATQFNDLKERMTRFESAQATKTTSVSQLISWGLLAVAVLAFVVPIISRIGSAAVGK